mgnify:CR=1 FL=1
MARYLHAQRLPRERRRSSIVNCSSYSRAACSRASCSATRRERSPTPSTRKKGLFDLADGGTPVPRRDRGDGATRSSRSCCACSRPVRSVAWAATPTSRSTCASSRRHIATSSGWWGRDASARTSTTGSTSVPVTMPPLRERARGHPGARRAPRRRCSRASITAPRPSSHPDALRALADLRLARERARAQATSSSACCCSKPTRRSWPTHLPPEILGRPVRHTAGECRRPSRPSRPGAVRRLEPTSSGWRSSTPSPVCGGNKTQAARAAGHLPSDAPDQAQANTGCRTKEMTRAARNDRPGSVRRPPIGRNEVGRAICMARLLAIEQDPVRGARAGEPLGLSIGGATSPAVKPTAPIWVIAFAAKVHPPWRASRRTRASRPTSHCRGWHDRCRFLTPSFQPQTEAERHATHPDRGRRAGDFLGASPKGSRTTATPSTRSAPPRMPGAGCRTGAATW